MNVSKKALASLDICHHRGYGQIFTTTDAPRFSRLSELAKGTRESEVGWKGFLMP